MRGVADAMGLRVEGRGVAPRTLFAAVAPWGFADPRDARAVLQTPFPAIAFAAGRRAVPYLRRLKHLSPATFTVFFGNPRSKRHGADAIWAPAHDRLRGPDVIITETTPHSRTPACLAKARQTPDPRIAALPSPRAALLIGGATRRHIFDAADASAILAVVQTLREKGFAVMATASRRTPQNFAQEFRTAFADDPGVFLWDGDGPNPYVSLLATADAIVVTGDSTNMVSEAAATEVPVYVIAPGGAAGRPGALVDALVAWDRVRRWTGALDFWPVAPLDATPTVAVDIAHRFAAFQQARAG